MHTWALVVDNPQRTGALPPLLENIRFRGSTVEDRLLRAYELGQREGRIRGPPWLSYARENDMWRYSYDPAADVS